MITQPAYLFMQDFGPGIRQTWTFSVIQINIQAEAEPCQAQDKLGLAKPNKKLSLATSKHLGPFHFIK